MIDKKMQEKWEAKLKKAGLGIIQPMTDNSEGEMAQFIPVTIRGNVKNVDMAQLRAEIDSNDNFMDAYQITKVRTIDREIPEWTFNNKSVQSVLLHAFPRQANDSRQRERAGRWIRIIYLYYRMKQPLQVVAKEMGLTKPVVKLVLQRVNRTAKEVLAIPLPHPDVVSGEKGDETK